MLPPKNIDERDKKSSEWSPGVKASSLTATTDEAFIDRKRVSGIPQTGGVAG
jgi:hypothetical protein